MVLQEPVLRSVSIDIGWALAPRFPDVRGTLTDILRAATGSIDDWSWQSDPGGGPAVLVWDEEIRLHAIVQGRTLDIVSEAPDQARLAAAAEAAVPAVMEMLNVSEADWCGASATWTLAAESANDAEGAIERWLYNPALRDRLAPLGGRPDDLMLTVRFETDTGVATMMKTEVVTDEQAAEGPFFLSDVEVSEFPPAAVLVHLTRRHDDKFAAGAVVERSLRHLDQVLAQAARLLATVEARDDLPRTETA